MDPKPPPDVFGEYSRLSKSELRKPVNTLKDKDELVTAFLSSKGLVGQHIDSFNYFIEKGIRNIVMANKRIQSTADAHFYLEYKNVKVGKPVLVDYEGCRHLTTPHDCRLRDLTYSAPIHVEIEYVKSDKITNKNVEIGRIPIMLKSSKCVLSECRSESEIAAKKECPLDPGGYFIIRGTEKVLLMQEQLSKNRMIVEKDKKGIITCQVTSSSHDKKVRTNLIAKNGIYYLKYNSFTEDIPVSIIFKAMGFTELEIVVMTSLDEDDHTLLVSTFFECHKKNVSTPMLALQYIGERINQKRDMFRFGPKLSPIDEARELLSTTILAHVPVVDFNFQKKAVYLSCMLRRVIQAQKDEKVIDDRDYYGNKRIELAGSLISLLFEDLFKSFNQNIRTTYDKNFGKAKILATDASVLLSSFKNDITMALENAISSGNWNIRRFRMERQGVTQVLSRLSYIAALGMMTRVNSQFEKTRKVSGPRSLQASQVGVICPSDTPEGESCGLVKNLALMSHITTEIDPEPLIQICLNVAVTDIDVMNVNDFSYAGVFIVFINGLIVGTTEMPNYLLNTFKLLRRKGYINCFVSIYVDKKHTSVHISSDGGRLCRPYIIVENGKSLLTQKHIDKIKLKFWCFEDLLHAGVIEYLDVNELNDSFVAIFENNIEETTTHMEIKPFTILGVCAGLIPYPHHNQSPRNTYQCAMGKQAMGALGYNQINRIDTLGYHLVYPQKPLVKTRTIELIGFESLPAGHNAIVAVASFSGFDIEDAVVLNKASLDRGYGRCIVYKNRKVHLKTYKSHKTDRIVGPPMEIQKDGTTRVKPMHTALDMDGLPFVGGKVEPGQVMVNKEVPTNTQNIESGFDMNTPDEFKENRQYHRAAGPCYVEKVMVSINNDNEHIFKLKLREVRRPEIGDKFSSRHGQKGVTGTIINMENMFFTESGITPDMVMNPHGFPSRMTLGKQLEFMASKAGAIEGKLKYGTAFEGTPLEEVKDFLLKKGFNYEGKDIMYEGTTGQPVNCYIYVGPVYYQKLKHMVMDKMHARSKGPKAPLTRQPTEGRAKDGGLRLGEMERDCLVAHGTSMLLVERLMLSSDEYIADVCAECGFIGYLGWCQFCRSSKNVAQIRIPYAFKLLLQELISMNIRPMIKLKNYCS